MANRIFISYRRDDASGQAGRLYDHLVERFGENSVFMDIDTIPPGEEFDSYIDDALRDCYMCIVVIGQRWSIGCRPECGWNLRCVISNYVKLSDYRFAFKQLPG